MGEGHRLQLRSWNKINGDEVGVLISRKDGIWLRKKFYETKSLELVKVTGVIAKKREKFIGNSPLWILSRKCFHSALCPVSEKAALRNL